jgi:hypothetical protein
MLIKTTKAPITELPVSVADCKAFSKISYNDDDAIIEQLIRAANNRIEEYCNILLEKREVVSVYRVLNDIHVVLMYGNVTDLKHVKNEDNEGVEHEWYGGDMVELKQRAKIVTATYDSGFDVIPDDIKMAIKKIVDTNYTYRNDLGEGVVMMPNDSQATLNRYRINGLY